MRAWSGRVLIVPFLFSIFTCSVWGQDKMQIDLSDQGVSPALVKPGVTQVEGCYMHTVMRENKTLLMNPDLLVRHGINRWLEAQLLVVEGSNRDIFVEKTSQGVYPLALSVKTNLLSYEETTKLTLVTMVKVPFTSRSSDQQLYWSPAFAITFEHKVGGLEFSFNSGITQQAFANEWSVPLNAVLQLPVEDFSFFVNYYSQYGFHELPQHNAGAGVEYHLRRNFALFVSSGSTLNPRNSNYYFSGGLSARFD